MKLPFRQYLLSFLLMLLSGSAMSQLPGLSQIWLAPQLNTPSALSGSDYAQLSSHYRRQAISKDLGYQSIIINGSLPLYYQKGNRFGTAGISLLNERSGQFGLLNTNAVMLSYSHEVSLRANHLLVGGMQAGYFNRGINWSKVRTDSQWQHGSFDPDLSAAENWSDERSGALVINAGIGYHLLSNSGQTRFLLGLGATNLSRSRFNSLEGPGNESIPLGVNVYATGFALSTAYYDLSPFLRWQWEAGLSVVKAGALFRKALKAGAVEEAHLGLALFYSPQQTTTFSLQLAQPSYLLAIGYDLAMGTADPGTRNAVEVSLGWRLMRSSEKRSARH